MGNTIWEGFWQDQSKVVTRQQYIPTAMHNVLKHVVDQHHLELSAVAGKQEAAEERLRVAQEMHKGVYY